MNMKQKLLLAVIASALAAPAAFADNETSTQPVSVTVPQVRAILAVGSPVIGCTTPDATFTAGNNLTCAQTTGGTFNITVNSPLTGTGATGQTLSAKLKASSVTAGHDKFRLEVIPEVVNTGTATKKLLTGSDQVIESAMLNTRATGKTLTYSIDTTTPGTVPAYGSATVDVVYTLSDDA